MTLTMSIKDGKSARDRCTDFYCANSHVQISGSQTGVIWAPRGTFGNFWRHFCLSGLSRREILLISSG